jgi:hypothetical protein
VIPWIISLAFALLCGLAFYWWRRAIGWREKSNESDGLRADLQRESERADLHERRANEFFGIIQGVEAEADTWRRMYRAGMSKASNAQNWLLRDLADVIKVANLFRTRLSKHGETVPPVQVSPQLKDLVAEFEQSVEADVPRAPGKEEADRIEKELRGPAALNAPVDVNADQNAAD